MKKSNKFSPEIRERAVRMVQEHRNDYPSQWAAISSIAPKIGCVPETLREWVRKHEIDSGLRDGVNYLNWFAREGYPQGEMALMQEMDHNGLRPLLNQLDIVSKMIEEADR